MLLMEEKILTEGQVLPGGILKVGSFLNQQIDTAFLRAIGQEIARLYGESGVTKVLTIEASGIAIEKAFQGGGDALRAAGVRVESLAVIERMDDTGIIFRR